jgi:hypothetical protein
MAYELWNLGTVHSEAAAPEARRARRTGAVRNMLLLPGKEKSGDCCEEEEEKQARHGDGRKLVTSWVGDAGFMKLWRCEMQK